MVSWSGEGGRHGVPFTGRGLIGRVVARIERRRRARQVEQVRTLVAPGRVAIAFMDQGDPASFVARGAVPFTLVELAVLSAAAEVDYDPAFSSRWPRVYVAKGMEVLLTSSEELEQRLGVTEQIYPVEVGAVRSVLGLSGQSAGSYAGG